MKRGQFPDTFEFSPIPRPFITSLLANMESKEEIEVMLEAFNAIYQKKGNLKYCEAQEITTEEHYQETKNILDNAVDCGYFVSCIIEKDKVNRTLYFVNDKFGRNCLTQIANNNCVIEIKDFKEQSISTEERPNIYSLYENNIGQLTPIIIEELKNAEKTYPSSWIEEAFKEAVQLNKRSWKYIKAILNNWQTEGKKDGTLTRHTEADSSRFFQGDYGHLVKH